MHIRVLTLRYSASRGGFDDAPLADFVRQHRVLALSEHFFTVDEVPHLACVVRWQAAEDEGAPAEVAPPRRPPRSAAVDPRADLDPEQRQLYEQLRAWRRERATEEGLPAYSVLTNRQIAELARARPRDSVSLAAAGTLGAGKLRLFGEGILAVLKREGSVAGR